MRGSVAASFGIVLPVTAAARVPSAAADSEVEPILVSSSSNGCSPTTASSEKSAVGVGEFIIRLAVFEKAEPEPENPTAF